MLNVFGIKFCFGNIPIETVDRRKMRKTKRKQKSCTLKKITFTFPISGSLLLVASINIFNGAQGVYVAVDTIALAFSI